MKTLFLVIGGLALVATSAQASQLACRGGKNHITARQGYESGAGLYWDVWVDYKKGDHGALSYNIDPGQCSWVDVGMTDSEPAEFYYREHNIGFFNINWELGNTVKWDNFIDGTDIIKALHDSSQYLLINVEAGKDMFVTRQDRSKNPVFTLVPIRGEHE